jgi:hypothetical protein
MLGEPSARRQPAPVAPVSQVGFWLLMTIVI